MADEVDRSEEIERVHREAHIKDVLNAASKIPKGEPGECKYCGEESKRLVRGVCAPCRDRRRLP